MNRQDAKVKRNSSAHWIGLIRPISPICLIHTMINTIGTIGLIIQKEEANQQ